MSLIDKTKCFVMVCALGLAMDLPAQGIKRLFEDGSFSGLIQADVQYCLKDSANDRSEYVDKFLSSVLVEGSYVSRMLDAGVRFEMYENPLPGFERDFKGWGIPNFHLTLKLGKLTLTGGDFYEQFGGGLTLRTYQERSLGVDNALRGGRITYAPFDWMRLKAIAGVQRNRWEWSESWIKGGDLEMDINDWFPAMNENRQRLQVGGSIVSKHEKDEVILGAPMKRLNLPENVTAFSARLNYQLKSFTLQGEYAYKINDPSAENGYIYRPGQALVLNASYFRSGLGISLAAKHSDNMSFRSERSVQGNKLQINYQPAFTRQHTYMLAAMYPYATQTNGEVAFQGDLFYKFKKGTALGGKYGTDIRFNYAQIFSLKKDYPDGKVQPGTYGYTTSFFRIGDETYYRDVNIEMSHRLTRDFKLTLMYMNLAYNRMVEGKYGMIYAHTGVVEALYKINKKLSVRGELQYQGSKQEEGDWCAALLEFSVSPHWIFTLSDLYNNGGLSKDNYLSGSVSYTIKSHRIQLTGGQQRAGYNCAGGVCRYVPATKGFALSYTANF